ncbi:TetR family transcriptional regulator [Actinoplanes sp. NPDC051470]|uniref:TetR/AcrR family transcriptional regulator n=1 Tax=Actinoplanes sp. NPDC051470 TaxID=3157224 RepID=UPI0034215C5C
MSGFVRARRPEQKEQRATEILDAARELAIRDGVGLVSLAAIAAEVGLHKSALLKYFGTREEIFLRLSEAEWSTWADAVIKDLDGVRDGAAGLADVLARSMADRPLFCQLLTHSSLTLERNVSLDALRRSKVAAIGGTEAVVDVVHRLLPDVPRESCFELVAATALIAAGLWQSAHPPPVVLALYAEQGASNGFARIARIDLFTELSRFVRVFLAGLRCEADRPE